MTVARVPGKQKAWWEDGGGFFGHGYMEGDNSYTGYLSEPMTLTERTRQEVDGIVELLELQADQRLLDCPCGYGRHSLEIARRGIQVVGVDINREELHRAQRAAGTVANVRFMKEDMRFLKFSEGFDAVINMFYSFGFFETDEENFQVLRNFFSALKPGGKLLLHTDVNLSRVIDGTYKFAERRQLHSGRTLQICDSYDPESKRINGEWTLIDDNGMVEALTPYSVRVFSLRNLRNGAIGSVFKK